MKSSMSTASLDGPTVTQHTLRELLFWPYPKIALKRRGDKEPRFAQLLRKDGAQGKFLLREPKGHVFDLEEGDVIAQYPSAEAVVEDDWVLD